MKRAFPADIAKATGVSGGLIRKLADNGQIEMRRDWNGWRWTNQPEKAIQEVKRLLGGGEMENDSD